MSIQSVLLPVFAQAALTFCLLFWMARERARAVRAGQFDMAAYMDEGRGWPKRATVINNCYKNQFELPVLFFALVPLELLTHQAGLFFVALAWVFVATRILHAWFYVQGNLRMRAAFFAVGVMILFLAWLIFALNILFASL
jgi:hypothetical protein